MLTISDMATMDSEGRIRLVGRTKEMIIRGGENIYPKEIEELLHQHDAVQDVFVSQSRMRFIYILFNDFLFFLGLRCSRQTYG